LQKQRGNFAEATQNYAKAVDLTQLDSRKEIFKQQQLQVTISERRAARDVDGAAKASEELLQMKLSPDDAAAVLYQLGKMYSEAGRDQESADVYLRATKLNLDSNPSLAATIYAVLGDKYYDLGRLRDAIDAYQTALDLDPANQSHLKKTIDETKAELAKGSVQSQATAAATVGATAAN
jgi:tetratricopeptide (TPR) repeat protein